MAFQFPTDNLYNGRVVEVPQDDGYVVLYQWVDPPGLWKIINKVEGPPGSSEVFTVDVQTINTRPTSPIVNPFAQDPTTISTQQEVNWYLFDIITELNNTVGTMNDVIVSLISRVESLEDQIIELQ